MVVMVLEKVPRSFRGELTRWLLEINTGVFVGRVSATVRDLLWAKVVQMTGGGRCAMAYRVQSVPTLVLLPRIALTGRHRYRPSRPV